MDEKWIIVVYTASGNSKVLTNQRFNTDIQAKNYLRSLLSDTSTEWCFGEVRKVYVSKLLYE